MPIDGIQLSQEGNECLAFSKSPVLHIILDPKDAAQNYQLQLEKRELTPYMNSMIVRQIQLKYHFPVQPDSCTILESSNFKPGK